MFDLAEQREALLQFAFPPAAVALRNLRGNRRQHRRSLRRELLKIRFWFAYVAEEHGVFGAALLGAEVLDGAPVLSRHQLLGHAVAVKAGVAVSAPVLTQLMSEEEPAACKQEVMSLATNVYAERWSDQ